ncbi:hypothetical protein HA050_06155 [Iodobacter sp. HSC-16F04]|uniref:Lipoprotein n=1 Tax=Iodobacter violaceini TaxID=3044271 RepID=A0ABX0KTA6_9NEIS|nr:hypothetical protein [Iodobacter violacea]NHQ85702.1 hypothetical protein [Iodobacter violacea]
MKTKKTLQYIIILLLFTETLTGCTSVRSHITECQYEAIKLLINYNEVSTGGYLVREEELIKICMKARGFEFDTSRAERKMKEKENYTTIDSIVDADNWKYRIPLIHN